MQQLKINNALIEYLKNPPHATATVKGSYKYPKINGFIQFYQLKTGVLTIAEISGLPSGKDPCKSPVFGFHIHSGTSCSGSADDPFSDAMMHYNPKNCSHPYHAGDLPPVFSCGSNAFLSFLTNRFTLEEIIGKTIIIHSKPDDFTTQPSGNSGEKMACGVIFKNM